MGERHDSDRVAPNVRFSSKVGIDRHYVMESRGGSDECDKRATVMCCELEEYRNQAKPRTKMKVNADGEDGAK